MAISAISIAVLVNKHNTLSTIIALEGGHYWHVWNIAVPIIKPSLKACVCTQAGDPSRHKTASRLAKPCLE